MRIGAAGATVFVIEEGDGEYCYYCRAVDEWEDQ